MTDVLTWQPGVVLRPEALTKTDIHGITDALSPAQVMALTMWAEARSRLEPGKGWVPNPLDALVDIGNVIDNRVKDPCWHALGHKGVCLQRRQFSCWDSLGGPDNFRDLLSCAQEMLAGLQPTTKLQACLDVAEAFLAGRHLDLIAHATHYYAPASMVPLGRVPAWVPGAVLTVERYGHRFYRNVT